MINYQIKLQMSEEFSNLISTTSKFDSNYQRLIYLLTKIIGNIIEQSVNYEQKISHKDLKDSIEEHPKISVTKYIKRLIKYTNPEPSTLILAVINEVSMILYTKYAERQGWKIKLLKQRKEFFSHTFLTHRQHSQCNAFSVKESSIFHALPAISKARVGHSFVHLPQATQCPRSWMPSDVSTRFFSGQTSTQLWHPMHFFLVYIFTGLSSNPSGL